MVGLIGVFLVILGLSELVRLSVVLIRPRLPAQLRRPLLLVPPPRPPRASVTSRSSTTTKITSEKVMGYLIFGYTLTSANRTAEKLIANTYAFVSEVQYY